jgi:Leucine-rich repeat (LRR) protein
MSTPQSTPTQSSELSRKTLLKKYGRDGLSDATDINLKKKKFTKINPNTFRSLRHLEKIRLEENQVDEIEVTTFSDLISLEHLYLTHNKLKRIDSPILTGLTQLECVAFDENQIDYIIPHLFKGKILKKNKQK